MPKRNTETDVQFILRDKSSIEIWWVFRRNGISETDTKNSARQEFDRCVVFLMKRTCKMWSVSFSVFEFHRYTQSCSFSIVYQNISTNCIPLFCAWQVPIRHSIVASIPACHAGDRGSIPRDGNFCKTYCSCQQHSMCFCSKSNWKMIIYNCN